MSKICLAYLLVQKYLFRLEKKHKKSTFYLEKSTFEIYRKIMSKHIFSIHPYFRHNIRDIHDKIILSTFHLLYNVTDNAI